MPPRGNVQNCFGIVCHNNRRIDDFLFGKGDYLIQGFIGNRKLPGDL